MRKTNEIKGRKKKNECKGARKVVIVIMLIVVVLLIIVGLKSCNKEDIAQPNQPDKPSNIIDRDIAANLQKVKSPEYEKYEKELNELSQQASIVYTPSPVFGGENAKDLMIWYPNIGDADYIMVDIYVFGSVEPIYSSPLIPKDTAITVDKLDKELPQGTYACNVITTAVVEQDGQKIAQPNKPVTKIEITIAE